MRGSKPTSVLCVGRKLLGFNLWIETKMILAWGSKLTSVLCAGRKLLGFNLWIEIILVFSLGIEIDSVSVRGPKMTCFWCGDRLTSFLCGWSKLTWFLHAGRKSLGFGVSIEHEFAFVRVV